MSPTEATPMEAERVYAESDLRPFLEALKAWRNGDLRHRLTDAPPGVLSEIGFLLNDFAEQRERTVTELMRVHREIVTERRFDERLTPGPASGIWSGPIDAINEIIESLVTQVGNAADVIDAVAKGDLSCRMPHDPKARGEIRRLNKAINGMVDQLAQITSEVTRVTKDLGVEGRLGGRARLEGMSGSWRDLAEAVNTMSSRVSAQVRDIAEVTTAVAQGDLSRKVTVDAVGEMLQLKNTVNTMVDRLSAFAEEVTRVAREVGTEGRLGGQAQVRGVSGVWKDLTDSVNVMANNLTVQVRQIAAVSTAVAQGNLTKKITVDARGEIFELKETLNTMVDQLSAFADEVTRVAREVGTEGRLGGRAEVKGVSGVWKDLTDNVNSMANNLTYQVRNIAEVTTAVANGDLTRKIDVDAQGEILELKSTINTMVDQLSSFASEVTRVAREVGSEGRLGGQARVDGVAGTWKRLTESVNELAGNLTTQVRAIAEVTSAVARGDLTRSITVDAPGELAQLKDNINTMVAALRETTRANQEQDWLKSNLARISRLMQGHRDLKELARLIMSEVPPLVSAHYGACYLMEEGELHLVAGYGVQPELSPRSRFALGEGLVGQAALEAKQITIDNVPPGSITVETGLSRSTPAQIVVLPIQFEDQVLGVLELASFTSFSEVHMAFLTQFVEATGPTINTIKANSRTEALLKESQRLATELQKRSDELQRQQEELRRSNAELEEKAALLAKQNRAIEIQNFQIEQARRALEERAEQLAISSRYKSEFLANMSHELRTPLNSLLVLAKLLADNAEGNLTPRQVEFAKTIHEAGTALLQLINDILDLSKVEAGRMDIHPQQISLPRLVEYMEATFAPLAEDKELAFTVRLDPSAPQEIYTDEQRLQQVLRNLLSNAIKFTHEGEVRLEVGRAPADVQYADEALKNTPDMLAFRVIDTGIGIAPNKLDVIFEAFRQADGTTSRKYGGTGLGLSICRQIARLLGGEIHVASTPGEGSTFTLYLPAVYTGPLSSWDSGAAPAGTAAGSGPEPEQRAESVPPEAAPSSALTGLDSPRPSDADRWQGEDPLNGAKILIIDDDIRNVFALTSVLERHGATVVYAENGREGIEQLERNEDVALVLMDIMMPEMDGWATTSAIRKMPQFADLPIIALTAKVMHGDREKSIASGASDYVPKPVDVDLLLDRLRGWLAQSRSERGPAGRPEPREGGAPDA
ncbi:MAG: HAMP domain-containing protein [Actinomycetales bacterium]|uniref:HAMP domain-containing protein n=1 Tax=Thermobispora bispora TaxID=2006 RepID=UPI001980BCEA|nr:HAMP domain-containing protein [Thermobispora bispora]MBO2475085.1 hybrid sensor histidine kinase/response regulator [Actinomycetales bacterium]QSI46904.1 response regulator [Thermobispora bispora]